MNQAFRGFSSADADCFLAGAGTLFGLFVGFPLLLGFQTASHPLIEARAFCCTARIVASATPALVPRSEQWKPSPTPMGCCAVLGTFRLSADTVASLHGSPVQFHKFIENLGNTTKRDCCSRCPLAKKRFLILTFHPLYLTFVLGVFGIGITPGNICWHWR